MRKPPKVELMVKDGKRWVRAVTLYSALPELVGRATTTTTTTTVTGATTTR